MEPETRNVQLAYSVCVTQVELDRLEEEQTLEELQSLREIVHDWFRKQEEGIEVSSRHSHWC